jgi:hypothetical protein
MLEMNEVSWRKIAVTLIEKLAGPGLLHHFLQTFYA